MPTPRRLAALLLCALALAACSPATATPHASPTVAATATPSATPVGDARHDIPVAGQPPVSGTPWYLTVGDSVTFGFSLDPARFGTNSSWALQMQAMLAASGRPWKLYDTACSGERTDTYYTLCPGRDAVPFLAHTSQHDAAMAAVSAHRADLRAVFVELGSNDLLQAERRSINVDAATASLRLALARIVDDFHRAAPGVPVILCNFYNPLSNLIPATRPMIVKVNAMVAEVAAAHGARLADFYDAIDSVATGTDTHLCDYVDCAHTDLHPTIAGQTRLAHAAMAALDGH